MSAGSRALRWIERAVAALIVGFLAWYLVHHWQQVAAYRWTVDVPRLALATACLVASISGFVLVWRRLLRAFGASLSVADAHRVWYLGNLARYVPGKLLQLAGTAYLARAKGVSPVITVTSSIMAQIFVLFGAVAVAAVALPDAAGEDTATFRMVGYAVAVACVLITLTPAFDFLHRFAMYISRRIDLHTRIPFSERLLALATSTACMALFGFAFSLFVTATTTVPRSAMVPLMGICAAGYLTAYVAFFVPAGLGVREGVYAVLLAAYIPPSIAVAVAVLARLWVTLVELAVVTTLVARYGTADLRTGVPPSHG